MQLPQPDLSRLADDLRSRFAELRGEVRQARGEIALHVPVASLDDAMRVLRDEDQFAFEQLVDLCGVDFSAFGSGYQGLFVQDAINERSFDSRDETDSQPRFAVVYHLLSYRHNHRLRVRTTLAAGPIPTCPSVVELWPAANWFEREAFDLFGIAFTGHPDLRRLLTDYGFIGHPFRRDFPVYGKVEMRYDPKQGRVIYQPVSIKPREVVPRIRRKDNFGGAGASG
ncbi:MAG: NADH-quinone oxidoreductase subunit C [Betaproteobacteria bacterium]|nr:NADH-quinone oxidoreductase subunit C [Betaproteobacteria bacterium]